MSTKPIHPLSVYAIGDRVTILPEWQDDGDAGVVWEVMSEDEGKGRVDISPVEWAAKWAIRPQQLVTLDMIERAPTNLSPNEKPTPKNAGSRLDLTSGGESEVRIG